MMTILKFKQLTQEISYMEGMDVICTIHGAGFTHIKNYRNMVLGEGEIKKDGHKTKWISLNETDIHTEEEIYEDIQLLRDGIIGFEIERDEDYNPDWCNIFILMKNGITMEIETEGTYVNAPTKEAI